MTSVVPGSGGSPTSTEAIAPAIAVVVATRGRCRLLPRLIDALADQDYAGTVEVVVVDDASPDGTWQELQRQAGRDDIDLTPLRLDRNGGPAVARNLGWRKSDGEIVVFTDDDCVPQAGWLTALAEGLRQADLVQGCTLPNPGQLANLGPFSHTISVVAENGHFETCNVAYRRPLLEAIGGFNEEFPAPLGEDLDLAYRARKAGGRTAFRPDAVVHHDVSPSSWRQFVAYRRRRSGFALACREHPELRVELSLGVFTHPTVLLTAVVAALAVRRPLDVRRWILLSCLLSRYAIKTVRMSTPPPRRRDWLKVVPLLFGADLVEIGVMAAASVRYRTLVL